MSKRRHFFSIRKKIFFSIAMTSAVVLLISTVISYFYFRDVLKKQVLTDQLQLANTCSSRIETMLNEVNRVSYYLASDQAVASLLTDPDILPSYAASRLNALTSRYVQTPLSAFLVSFQFLFFLSQGYALSDYLAATRTIDIYSANIFRDNALTILSERDYQDSDWYCKSRELDGSLYSFSAGPSSDTVYFSRVVRNIYLSQNPMGTLVLGIQKNQLYAIMNESVVYPSSQIYLSYRGKVLCTAGEALELDLLSEENALAGLAVSDNFQSVSVGQTSYYGIRHDLGSGYSLIYLTPAYEIYHALDGVGILMLFELLGAAIISMGVAVFFSFQLSHPILYLTSMIQKVDGQESLAVILEEKARNDEIGVLFHQYNQMLQRIVRLMKDIQESTQREKQAELRALQEQINPHFVFNTLDSINWIAMCEEEQEISLMVTSLANMLRYSILGEVNEAKLEDEITYLEEYCRIQQLRYPDAFTISIEIDPALNGYKIPKMLLQPLVENAIVHNLGAHPEAGAGLYIRLTSQITEDRLILRVSNTGKGNFQLLNRYLQGQEDLIPKGKGFGIRNINRRIRLLYGEQYGLSYYPWLNYPRGGGAAALPPTVSAVVTTLSASPLSLSFLCSLSLLFSTGTC